MVLRIFKMIATSGFLTALARVHQIHFRSGLRPLPHWGTLQRSPKPLAGLRGTTSKEDGRERASKRKKGEEERKGKGPPPDRKFLDPPLWYSHICVRPVTKTDEILILGHA